MKKNESSMTSLISCFSRVYHCENDQPVIFNDSIAKKFFKQGEYEQIAGYMKNGLSFFAPELSTKLATDEEKLQWVVQTQLAPTPIARAAFTENIVSTEIHLGAAQYVILGAGMDTFGLRDSENIKVFEVDQSATQQFKRERIEEAGLEIPSNLIFVSTDFTKDDLAEKLIAAGFKKNEKTVFSLLGVSYYLPKEFFDCLLDTVSSLMVDGSSIVFDAADEMLFHSEVKRVQNMIAMAKQSGELMQASYAYNELEQLLQKHNLLIYEHITPEQINETYFANRSDYLQAFEHIHYYHAVCNRGAGSAAL